MTQVNCPKDIINFAIESEQEAYDFYMNLAEQAKSDDMKKVFIQFAEEEMGHKKRLKGILESGHYTISDKKVQDLKIADYLVEMKPSPNMTYQDALVLAMQKEKAAFKLYTRLSEMCTNEMLSLIFSNLAQEESKHKLRFEIEYDEMVLKEN